MTQEFVHDVSDAKEAYKLLMAYDYSGARVWYSYNDFSGSKGFTEETVPGVGVFHADKIGGAIGALSWGISYNANLQNQARRAALAQRDADGSNLHVNAKKVTRIDPVTGENKAYVQYEGHFDYYNPKYPSQMILHVYEFLRGKNLFDPYAAASGLSAAPNRDHDGFLFW